ncbi:MAG TPA: hypothetical protein VFC65_09975 [Prolixibacteraceae bacterium]|nr:hypothetical protein [Prolixibacteraceae bacterium]
MEFSNQTRCKKIKRTFNLTGIIIVLTGLVFLWLKNDVFILIAVGIFAVYVGISVYANLCYVFFSSENGKVRIRYYPVISIVKKEYDSIEFMHQSLVNFQIEKALGFADLDIAIKTKRGIAEYPTISLAALSKSEIEQIRLALTEIMRNNR